MHFLMNNFADESETWCKKDASVIDYQLKGFLGIS